MTTLIDHHDGTFEIYAWGIGPYQHCYDLRLVSGGWPSDDHLLSMCDNRSADTSKHHFGGVVTDTGMNTKRVKVYVD